MLLPTKIDQLKALCERGHPVWVVSCTHPVPALHRVGRRRAMVAMLLTQPPAEIARQLGVHLNTIRDDIKALTTTDRALAQDARRRKVQTIKKKYGTVSTSELAASLGMTRNAVIGVAHRLGLSKSEAGSRPAASRRASARSNRPAT